MDTYIYVAIIVYLSLCSIEVFLGHDPRLLKEIGTVIAQGSLCSLDTFAGLKNSNKSQKLSTQREI